jgi:hypothetical protein
MKRRTIALALVLFGCAAGAAGPLEPVWGKQPCDHCMMLLSESPPAAQALMSDGSRKYFDDIGCLAGYLGRTEQQPKAAWVRGPDGTGWIDAFTARYSAGHRTPMDYGFHADTTGLTFAEVQARVRAKSVSPAEEQ